MKLQDLPSVDLVLSRLPAALAGFPRTIVVQQVRRALEEMRAEIRSGTASDLPAVEVRVMRALEELRRPSLRRVINATGVILHTNLGRAPLSAYEAVPAYSNLEFDLATGARGRRDAHVAGLLEQLLGKPAIAVNNNAAAVYLVLHELAAGGEVIVSRGELVEIGDGFRIPDIMTRSGAVVREVGTTNRTRIEDYRDVINERTRLILRVHPSNFRMSGFTSRPGLGELVSLGRESGVPVYEDLGSGCLLDLRPYGIDEPLAGDSLRDGVDLVSFSGDKLLGGPQAGVIAGNFELVARLRHNPMFRALRLDKLVYQALETTLRRLVLEEFDAIPTLRMIRASAEEIRVRAQSILGRLGGFRAEVIQGESVIGGGSTPGQSLPTWLIAIRSADVNSIEERLRTGEPPVIARIEAGQLMLDLRTVAPEEEEALVAAVQALSR
jgi:L-seryl-tRNA(Ser) seleniumtransferase